MAKQKASKKSAVQAFLASKRIGSFEDVLAAASPRPSMADPQEAKKNYAQRLSEGFAVLVAERLRAIFPGILPTSDGRGAESPARTGKGVKKLDVNYSTPQLGLGLGVSVKTLNFRDPGTDRYTKNPTRLDNELRAEAMDYHDRQPFAVLVALVLVPLDACDDGDPNRPRTSRSSFAQIVNVLRHRVGRESPREEAQLFERGFVGLYEHEGRNAGRIRFFDIEAVPPQFGAPKDTFDLDGVMKHIVNTYDARNTVKPPWEKDNFEAVPFADLVENEVIPLEGEDDDDSL